MASTRSPDPTPPHIAHHLLALAHPPETVSTIFRDKIQHRPLLLRPSTPDPERDARSKRQYKRHQKENAQRRSKKPKPLSAKQKRKLCLYEIPKAQRKYAIYKPLNRLWRGYMREILDLKRSENGGDEGDREGRSGSVGRTWVDAAQVGPVLVSADYHGAELEVVRSRCESLVGLRGIVVKDGKFAFEVVTRRDEVKCLPKRGSVFRVEVPFEEGEAGQKTEGVGKGGAEDGGDGGEGEKRKPLVFDIYGSQFEARAPDRANRKFRWHYDPDL